MWSCNASDSGRAVNQTQSMKDATTAKTCSSQLPWRPLKLWTYPYTCGNINSISPVNCPALTPWIVWFLQAAREPSTPFSRTIRFQKEGFSGRLQAPARLGYGYMNMPGATSSLKDQFFMQDQAVSPCGQWVCDSASSEPNHVSIMSSQDRVW